MMNGKLFYMLSMQVSNYLLYAMFHHCGFKSRMFTTSLMLVIDNKSAWKQISSLVRSFTYSQYLASLPIGRTNVTQDISSDGSGTENLNETSNLVTAYNFGSGFSMSSALLWAVSRPPPTISEIESPANTSALVKPACSSNSACQTVGKQNNINIVLLVNVALGS